MNTSRPIFALLTEPQHVFPKIMEALSQIDPSFDAEHQQYITVVNTLKGKLNEETETSLSEFLAAKESEFCSEVIYAAWLGFQQNYNCYKNPVATQFLNLDFEDIYREDSFEKLPGVVQACRTINKFYAEVNAIVVGEDDPTEGITEFYSYLETAVFKLAHYWGFIFADRFLEKVVPGYTHNPALILRYRRMLEDYLGYDIGFLHEF